MSNDNEPNPKGKGKRISVLQTEPNKRKLAVCNGWNGQAFSSPNVLSAVWVWISV